METMFPFGFDTPLAFYLAVHVVTLAVHVFLMNYVLAGSSWLAWTTLFPGPDTIARSKQPLAMVLRDWMPFVLSGAITAGVAPLLFVQILYRRQFYTANLLLGPRWMIVIPVLIVAFYLLYVLKSKTLSRWPRAGQSLFSIGAAACFLFVAFCWTTNSLVTIEQTAWPEMYRSGSVVLSKTALMTRLLTWIAGSFAIMSVLASWQLWGMRRRDAGETAAGIEPIRWHALHEVEEQRLAKASIAGLATAVLSMAAYLLTLEQTVLAVLFRGAGMIWALLAGLSIALQAAGWMQLLRSRRTLPWRIVITLASVATLLSTASLRELLRLSQLDLDQITIAAKEAAQVGGFVLFLVVLLLTTLLMAYCVYLVRQSRRSDSPQDL